MTDITECTWLDDDLAKNMHIKSIMLLTKMTINLSMKTYNALMVIHKTLIPRYQTDISVKKMI